MSFPRTPVACVAALVLAALLMILVKPDFMGDPSLSEDAKLRTTSDPHLFVSDGVRSIPSTKDTQAPGLERKRSRNAARAFIVPVTFEPNRGQAPPSALFVARYGRATALFTRTGVTLIGRSRIHVDFCERDCTPRLETRMPGVTNYFVGPDPRHWQKRVPQFARLRYPNVAPGIDLIFYGRQGLLEYDVLVRRGADPSAFKMKYAPQVTLAIAEQGDLTIESRGAVLTQHAPHSYQITGGRRHTVRAAFRVTDHTASFTVEGYDRFRDLIIDPVMSYSTLLGGSSADTITAVTVDSSGHAFVTGATASGNFPDVGSFDCTEVIDGCRNDFDVVVTKLNASGTRILYSDILGDTGDEFGLAIAVDKSGSAYVAGKTEGMAIPTIGPSGRDVAFVFKFNPQGSALTYARQFGGCCETFANAIAVDSQGHAYVAGTTASPGFPVTAGSLATEFGGERVGFLAKLNIAGTSFLYSTFISPSSDRVDIGGLAVDSDGFAYVAGTTTRGNLPTTAGSLQPTFPSAVRAGFLLKVNPAGSAAAYGTYYGGGIEDWITGLAIDSSRNAYVSGFSDAQGAPGTPTPPTTPGAFKRSRSGSSDAFVAKFDASASALLYGTLLGGSGRERATGIALNSSGNAFVVGVTDSTNFPTTTTAFQRIATGGVSGFVTKLNSSATALRYSSYLGGRQSVLTSTEPVLNSPNGVAVINGNAYLAGDTVASDFPTSLDAFQTKNAGVQDGFIVKVIEPSCTVSTVDPSVSICVPTDNATAASPVRITALTNSSKPVRTVQVYLDGVKIYQARLSAFTQRFSISPGSHRLTVQAIDISNLVFKKTIQITVK